MSRRREQLEELIAEGARDLLARAEDDRTLDLAVLQPRLLHVVEKYLLRDDENASAEEIASFLAGVHADDLCLVLACEHGDQRAWDDLVERFGATVKSAARSTSANESSAEELAQSIWAELYGLREREDGRPASKLAYYSGRGSLAGWLRAVVGQLAIDQHRKQTRLVQTEEDSEFDRPSPAVPALTAASNDGTASPETALANKLAARQIQNALTRALQDLSDEDRLLVKLYYFDDLRLREAGAVLGVHEATASRRLTRIHGDLRTAVERMLVEEENWTKAEVEQAFAEVALNLETEFGPLLAASGAPDETARVS